MNSFRTIKIESAAHITTLTFKRTAKSNSLTPEFMNELGEAIAQVLQDAETRCLIVTGNGRAFCSGVDVDVLSDIGTMLPRDELRELVKHWQGVFTSLENLPQLTVAAINGVVLGAGLEMALACDFRIASTRAFFGMPQVKFGILPDLGGITRLARTVGPAWTKEIVFRGRNFNAMEALRVGLVNRVAEPGDLLGTAQKWAAEFAALPPAAVRSAKEVINGAFDGDLPSALAVVREAQARLMQTDEFRVAVRAAREEHPVEG
jgi:enoyl-CoA hydratase/carnithine racemase